ncbi:MBL fold metallo-hydrolase [Paenibacillus agaridevorans]|uniref:MBL fold metallo-hydrolase n=2 Tax=Paenibacillus agaridevorans TaxID=171404 RepID=A0A2R5F2Q5_9BACL|nr:MBL fold metallo-hydrolase [Paenibacillus agaridevorans]
MARRQAENGVAGIGAELHRGERAMKLTVLGNNGTFPRPGGACSGYLLEHGGRFVLLECGNGVMSRLQTLCPIDRLEGIVVSHLHDDHCGDLRILKYAVETKRALGAMERIIPVYMPASPGAEAGQLHYPEAFDTGTINENTRLAIGDLHFRFARMMHSVETYAVEVSWGCGNRLVYSSDTTLHEGLIEFAKGADVLLCEATTARRGAVALPHMTAGEAGYAARTAGVGQLILTHFWCDEKEEECLQEAQAYFDNTETAEEMKQYEW